MDWQKCMLMGLLLMVSNCYNSSGLTGEDGNGLVQIQVIEPEANFVERADLTVTCIGCKPNDIQVRHQVNVDILLEKKQISALNEDLKKYQFTRNSVIKVEGKFYDANDVLILRSCSGSDVGCSDFTYQLNGQGSVIQLPIRFEPISANSGGSSDFTDELLEVEDTSVIEVSGGLLLTANPDLSIENGHCVAEYIQNGVSLGHFSGHYIGGICFVAIDSEVRLINQNVLFVSRNNEERYDIEWLSPNLLEQNRGPDEYQGIVVGIDMREGLDEGVYVCKDAATARYGKTKLVRNGFGFFEPCFVPTGADGRPTDVVQRVDNYLI